MDVRYGLFRTLRILSLTGSGILSFLIALVALRLSKVDLVSAIVLAAVFSAAVVLVRVASEK